MKLTTLALLMGLSGSITLLTGCGDTTTAGLNGSSQLQGSVFKGPIDQAQIRLMDQQGRVLAEVQSQQGTFQLPKLEPLPEVLFVQSFGGMYSDEATGLALNLTLQMGLQAIFTATELQDILAQNQFITMTPETTLLTELSRFNMAQGMAPQTAIDTAKTVIESELLQGTDPTGMMNSNDTLLRTGNLSNAIPADNAEALARNRAISFSYETQSLGLSPEQVFELINRRQQDLQDGQLDGLQHGQPLQITSTDGQTVVAMEQQDQHTSYGQARNRLLQTTVSRLMNGQLSSAERAELAQMGIDTSVIDQAQQQSQQATQVTQDLLLATNLPAFKYPPVMSDEDGDPNNGQATYTFNAEANVAVTIDTPNGSWQTPMLRYNGYQLPPIIKAKRGDELFMTLQNNLSEESTIHWHGFKIAAIQDGNPDVPTLAGAQHQYQFTLDQPAAPLWFHPHPHMRTAHQVYQGLAGAFIVEDDISQGLEASKKLPSGAFDIPVLVQDRRFTADNGSGQRELLYMDQPQDSDGMLGDVILVNGVEIPKLEVATRQYRLRLYNASNARSYDFALSNGAKFFQVATDGGLLPNPVEVDHLTMGAGERAEIVIDFSQFALNDKVMLISKPFSGGAMMAMDSMSGGSEMGGMSNTSGMGNMGSGGGMGNMGNMSTATSTQTLANGAALNIMRFDITRQESDDITLYSQLPVGAEIHNRFDASTANTIRPFVMSMNMGSMGSNNGMSFVINGKSFDMSRVDEYIPANALEIWEIRNMSPMAHPFHAHAIQWQVLDRNGAAASGADLGWKDTVLVQPGETVRMIGQFEAVNIGKYMYHCHILEHEDAGMMGFFEVLAAGVTPPAR